MDTVSNFVIKIKNAGNAGLEEVFAPYSKLKLSIAEALKKEGFIKDFEERQEKGKKVLKVSLFSEDRVPKIKGIKRISKPSRRIYRKAKELRPVRSGYGVLIVSTSSGVMTGREAKKAKLGGEALFTIW